MQQRNNERDPCLKVGRETPHKVETRPEAQEQPLLEAVIRQLLVKILRDKKVWKLAMRYS
jgi:hypothetical protein